MNLVAGDEFRTHTSTVGQRDDWSLETRLQYLLGGRGASVGFIHPERALEGLLDELRTHDLVTDAATRAAVQGVLREMAPPARSTAPADCRT